MATTARRAAIATLVVGGIVVAALALWKLKLLVALLFFALILAAAMRPSIEWLRRHRVPMPVGLMIHYAVLVGVVALLLVVVVPRAIDQVQGALGAQGSTQLHEAAQQSTGIKHEVLTALDRRLRNLPKAGELVHPALEVTKTAFEVLVGILFVLASAGYWIFERGRALDFVASLWPRPKRKRVRDTWDLIDLKLGAFVRGQAVLIVLVAVMLSTLFWIIGLPYFILIGAFAGLVEIVPVIGPLAAGALAVGVGLTVSWHVALAAGLCVLGVRLTEDYLVIPRVLGEATGLSPLTVLVSVTAVGLLFGGFAVILAVPLAAVLVTLVDVVVRNRNPAEQQVPTVLFPAREADQ
jgi:predicted PurR-regulated permease PerM